MNIRMNQQKGKQHMIARVYNRSNTLLTDNENDLLSECLATIDSSDSDWLEGFPTGEVEWFDTASLQEISLFLLDSYQYLVQYPDLIDNDKQQSFNLYYLGTLLALKESNPPAYELAVYQLDIEPDTLK